MELIDIVNHKNEVIGQTSRDEAHKDPSLLHRAVHFTLIDNISSTILLTKRSYSKENDAGKLCFLGEHLTTGESYQEALIRGVKEELDISILASQTVELGEKIFAFDNQTEIVKFYVCFQTKTRIKYDHNEIEDVYWLNLAQLKEPSLNTSDMTAYWINSVNWSNIRIH